MAKPNPTQAKWRLIIPELLGTDPTVAKRTEVIFDSNGIVEDEIDKDNVVVIAPQQDPFSMYRLLAKLESSWPNNKKVAIIDYYHSDFIQDLVTMGVKGILSVHSTHEKLISTIKTVAHNNLFVDTSIQDHAGKRSQQEESELTAREQQIIVFIVQGLTSFEIADRLCLSEHTIKSHRKLINKKLDVHSPAQLVKYAVEHDLYF